MNQLDLSRINEASPYEVRLNKHGFFQFKTRAGVVLAVGFDDDDLLNAESYQFIIVNTNNKPSPQDPLVRITITEIIREFFRVNNATMLYICETADRKQAMRSRLFSHWFDNFNERKNYTFIQSRIDDEEGVVNYFAIIVRKDNPNYSSVIDEFSSAIKFFSEKPKE